MKAVFQSIYLTRLQCIRVINVAGEREHTRKNTPELRGVIGVIRVQIVGENRYATMSVATNYCYKGGDGCPVIETTWHFVTAWEGSNCSDLDLLHKGDKIHVTGRLRCRKYMDSAGIERTQTEIVASNLEKAEGN